ncbi:MAG TPA: hypothetical protein VMC09_17655 [Anaerolineales bacterium]|nr:hypothetical protein [Anaerolineales bacterium]
MSKNVLLVAVFITPGVSHDGGGIMILPGGGVVRVPPRGPDIVARIHAIAHLMAHGIAARSSTRLIEATRTELVDRPLIQQIGTVAGLGANEYAVMWVSPGVTVDGGGFGITPDGHIVPIPPWNPMLLAKLELTGEITAKIASYKNPGALADFGNFAAKAIAGDLNEVISKVMI